MRIVELGDCSMVIMKDSEDPPWRGVGDVYRLAIKYNSRIAVERFPGDNPDFNSFGQATDNYVYTVEGW